MTKPNFKQANKRYQWLFVPAMLFYGVGIVAGNHWVQSSESGSVTVATLAGLAAGIPMTIAIWALWRFARETDEYNRQVNLQSMAFAGVVTASLAALVGFVQMYEALPMFPAYWFVVIYFAAYGLKQIFRGKDAKGCDEDAS
jgi:fucose 4-O-acetylase-like acetyltransferase